MMNFLPIIYEDELLYSVLARYKQMCGIISKTALVKDLFNKNVIITSVLFPQHLKVLVSNLPPSSKLDVDELIENHTMFPFYTAFLSEKKTNQVFEGMAGSYGGGVEKIVGLGGTKVKHNEYLQYCPVCFRLDKQTHGESYWRRVHQIPGAMYCDIHKVLLKQSEVLCTDSRVDYRCADDDTCDEEVVQDTYLQQLKAMNLKYVEDARFLMKENKERKELSFIISFYIDRLRERGFASNRGFLYMQEFQHAFIKHFPQHYLELMQSGIDVDDPTNWLRLFVRNNGKNRHSLRHLLLIQFLGIKADTMFNADTVVGKMSSAKRHHPSFSVIHRREQWLQIIAENPGATRVELKEIGRGLHTWIYKHDLSWYEQVTPRVMTRKKRSDTVDWDTRDKECLQMAKQAVQRILSYKGKPIRVSPATIRRELGVKGWFKNMKLKRTQKYIKEVTEGTRHYQIRKIQWAIEDFIQTGLTPTAYRVQLHAGFGGKNDEMKALIKEIIGNMETVLVQRT